MAKYLSQEWLDLQKEEAQEFPERPGATARMQYVITGAPDGDVKYFCVIDNGKMLENTLGEDPAAEFTMTQGYDDSIKVLKGELDANTAFMQGRVKVTGNMAKLMALLPITSSPEYRDLQSKIRELTDY